MNATRWMAAFFVFGWIAGLAACAPASAPPRALTPVDDLIVAHAQGKPLRAIAMVYRRSPVAFIALADSGITRYPDDYGIHFYSDGIFATDDLIAKNPDLVRRFLRATLKGWTFAVENPTAVGPMVVKYKPDADAALENAKMTAALPFVNTGEDTLGWMKPEIWSGMEKTVEG